MRTRLLLALCITAVASVALAQSAIERVTVQGPGGLCLAVQGHFTEASPPPPGTHVVLATCDGSDTQRWGLGYGDIQGTLYALGRQEIGADASHAVVLTAFDSPASLRNGSIYTSRGCVTSTAHPTSGDLLKVMRCDGRPEQHFAESRL
jgi:hypothetical protein